MIIYRINIRNELTFHFPRVVCNLRTIYSTLLAATTIPRSRATFYLWFRGNQNPTHQTLDLKCTPPSGWRIKSACVRTNVLPIMHICAYFKSYSCPWTGRNRLRKGA